MIQRLNLIGLETFKSKILLILVYTIFTYSQEIVDCVDFYHPKNQLLNITQSCELSNWTNDMFVQNLIVNCHNCTMKVKGPVHLRYRHFQQEKNNIPSIFNIMISPNYEKVIFHQESEEQCNQLQRVNLFVDNNEIFTDQIIGDVVSGQDFVEIFVNSDAFYPGQKVVLISQEGSESLTISKYRERKITFTSQVLYNHKTNQVEESEYAKKKRWYHPRIMPINRSGVKFINSCFKIMKGNIQGVEFINPKLYIEEATTFKYNSLYTLDVYPTKNEFSIYLGGEANHNLFYKLKDTNVTIQQSFIGNFLINISNSETIFTLQPTSSNTFSFHFFVFNSKINLKKETNSEEKRLIDYQIQSYNSEINICDDQEILLNGCLFYNSKLVYPIRLEKLLINKSYLFMSSYEFNTEYTSIQIYNTSIYDTFSQSNFLFKKTNDQLKIIVFDHVNFVGFDGSLFCLQQNSINLYFYLIYCQLNQNHLYEENFKISHCFQANQLRSVFYQDKDKVIDKEFLKYVEKSAMTTIFTQCYPYQYKSDYLQCNWCKSECLTCLNEESCISCRQSNSIFSNQKCQLCKPNEYANINNQCSPCHSTCKGSCYGPRSQNCEEYIEPVDDNDNDDDDQKVRNSSESGKEFTAIYWIIGLGLLFTALLALILKKKQPEKIEFTQLSQNSQQKNPVSIQL